MCVSCFHILCLSPVWDGADVQNWHCLYLGQKNTGLSFTSATCTYLDMLHLELDCSQGRLSHWFQDSQVRQIMGNKTERVQGMKWFGLLKKLEEILGKRVKKVFFTFQHYYSGMISEQVTTFKINKIFQMLLNCYISIP